MKQEQQAGKGRSVSLFIISSDEKEIVSVLNECCCQSLLEFHGVGNVSIKECVLYSIDFWGHKQVKGPAFPPSLFLNDEELQKLIDACADERELEKLFSENEERIKENESLRKLFERKQNFRNELER